MKILLLQAGGTVDKDYPMGDDHHGYGFEIGSPAFDKILKRVNPGFEFETQSVLKKDSLDVTDDDRNVLLGVCQDTSSDKIVITHGTDTMIKTAETLSKIQSKSIVLTGAMSPERFKDSDADFNLGFAIATAGIVEHGVYIAMNGQVFEWDNVLFDQKLNRFVQRIA